MRFERQANGYHNTIKIEAENPDSEIIFLGTGVDKSERKEFVKGEAFREKNL